MFNQSIASRFPWSQAAAFLACVLALSAQLTAADEKPVTNEGDSSISAIRKQTLKGFTYFYKSTETSFEDIKETVEKTIPELRASMAQSNIASTGSLVFIYHGITADPKAKFRLEIGMPVAEGTKPAGDFKVRDVPEYRCSSVLYSGRLSGLSDAFTKLYTGALAKATDEAREMYLYFEGPDSPNNVVHVSLGTKD